jgi:hypothetical protein
MIQVDPRHWPLVVIEYRGTLSMTELLQSHGELDGLLERKRPFVTVGDISALRTPGVELLRRQAGWYREREDQLRMFCLASATIADSPMVRGILKAVNWIHRMPQPQAVVGNFGEGLDFVESKLKEQQLALPPSAARLRDAARRS